MEIRKKFFGAVVPSVLAFALSGVYAIVDGFFIGNCVGDNGLAAINLAYPVTAFLQALGTGIGMGGSVRFSIAAGQGDLPAQRRYFSLTLAMLALAGLACTLALLPLCRPLLVLLGARAELLGPSQDYLGCIALGAAFQVLGTGIAPLIRNLGGAVWAMVAMIGGFVTNILLDWHFIYNLGLGMKGAALATVLGQGVTALLCGLRLLRCRQFFTRRFAGRALFWARGILLVGVSPFGLTFSPNLVLILMNRSAMNWGGAQAVAQYAAISYLTCIVLMLLQGVGDGSQPLMSWCSGQRDGGALSRVCRLAYSFAGCTVLAACTLLYLVRYQAPLFFGASEPVAQAAGGALPLFLLGLFCAAFLRVLTSRFYATGANGRAYLLIYGEPLFLALLLAALPRVFGLWGVWAAAPLSQLLAAALGALLALVSQPSALRSGIRAERWVAAVCLVGRRRLRLALRRVRRFG